MDSGIEVFFSYSHNDADERLRGELVKQLKALERAGIVKVWDDRKIIAGDEWGGEISAHLESAQIILLLISSDFIASDYCYSIEMARAFERHNEGNARVVPIILRPCPWKEIEPLQNLQVLPDDGRPVTKWEDEQSAFLNIAEGLLGIIRAKADQGFPASEPASDYPPITSKLPPALLPYLCDRNPQQDSLDDALDGPVEIMTQRPVVCIIYGSEYECHDKFREQLQQASLRKILYPGADPPSIKDRMLVLPSSYESDERCHRVLRRQLAARFLRGNAARDDEIRAALAQFPAPVIIHSLLSTEIWKPDTKRLIKAFLSFWNNSWVLPPGPHLFVCLHIEYNKKRPEYMARESEVEAFLRRLKPSDYADLHLVLLPELTTVPELEVNLWANDEEYFSGFCPTHSPKFCDVQSLLDGIDDLYRDPELTDQHGRIPMQLLARRLKKMLKDSGCHEERI